MLRTIFSVKTLTLALILFSISIITHAQPGRDSRATSQPAGRINGQVRMANGQPAGEILVSCDAWSGGMIGQIRTDSGGRFHFDSLGPAQFTVSVRQPGYIPVSETVDMQTTSSAYVQLLLKPDPNAAPIAPSAVVDSSVPIAAQKEFEKAEAAIASGKKEGLAEAIRHYQAALTIYPQFSKAELKLGTAYMDLGEWDKAEQTLKKTIEMDPKAVNGLFALGEIYLRQKNDEAAEKVLLQGLQIDDHSSQGHLNLGRAYWSMAGKLKEDAQSRPYLEKAYEQVKKALELNPDYAQAHLLKGNLLLRVRRAADAQHEFEEYLRLDPKGAFAEQTRVTVDKIKKALESQPKP